MKETLEKVSHLDEAAIDGIVQAFMDYTYGPQEDSQFYLFKSREHVDRYLRRYIRCGLAKGQIYTWNRQGYVLLSRDHETGSLLEYLGFIVLLFRSMGFLGFFSYLFQATGAGEALETKMIRRNKSYIHVEMLAVLEDYQHQGIMRKMMDGVLKMARAEKRVVILETDCKSKAERYKHLGLRMQPVRKVTDRFTWYDFMAK